jgi:hypothetical protein
LSQFVPSASQPGPSFRAVRRLEPPTGHVFRRDGARRSTWYAKYRLPDGRQVQKRIGPAWTERGRPAAGHFTKRAAEAWLRDVLDEARRGTLPGLVQTGATFADAAAEFLRYVEYDRAIKPSTLTDYRSIISAHLEPAFGPMRVEEVTPEKIERWRATVTSTDGSALANRTKNKLLVLLHGVFARAQKVYGLPRNPVAEVERHPQRSSGDMLAVGVRRACADRRESPMNGGDELGPEDLAATTRKQHSERAPIPCSADASGIPRAMEAEAQRGLDVAVVGAHHRPVVEHHDDRARRRAAASTATVRRGRRWLSETGSIERTLSGLSRPADRRRRRQGDQRGRCVGLEWLRMRSMARPATGSARAARTPGVA